MQAAHPGQEPSTLEVVMTTIGAGARRGKETPGVCGLHAIGTCTVTALSEWTVARVQRGGRSYEQKYERGKAVADVCDTGPARGTGTTIRFKPDPEIFHGITFDYDTLEGRLRELAFLNKGLTINLDDERSGKKATFRFDDGISDLVRQVNRGDEVLHPVFSIEKVVDGVGVDVALQYTASNAERILCYTNNAYNSIGGTHLIGFRTALRRALIACGAREGLLKEGLFKDGPPIGDDFCKGLTVVIHVKVPEPQFDAQEKKRLNNLEVEGIVAGVVGEYLAKFLEKNPKVAGGILKKVALAAEARESATRAWRRSLGL
jgi:DNA gyrase subunit B